MKGWKWSKCPLGRIRIDNWSLLNSLGGPLTERGEIRLLVGQGVDGSYIAKPPGQAPRGPDLGLSRVHVILIAILTLALTCLMAH